ncbi:nuclear receptor corepressor 1 isoform X2 [Fopius arisanus]|uniref:Ncor1_1 protein n=1 Tax=Fopius arisanus TaxID=64838 RepID=A0A0C9RWC5_9HYME|nr:PREDICTED: nuclear receptor corepressor 1 isoform X2 [Fopius arisanus]
MDPTQNYINIKSNSPIPARTVAVSSYVQGGTGTPSASGVGPPGNSGAGSTAGVTGSAGGNYVTVPVPSGLRYVHSYQPPPAPSAPVNQTPPPPGAAAAYTRDPYRNATSNVSERVAISVSSSPVTQVGVGVGVSANEYPPNSRGDRPRISLLPPASVAPSPSPTSADYHVTSNRNQRVLMPILAVDQYGRQVEMATLQEAPPFKKIRLGQSQQQPSCQTISPADVCIKQDRVQLPQPLRIDTRPTAGAYTPQTEAISPTLPEPTIQEDAAFRVTKDELLQQIGRVDREIAKREGEITTRRKKLKTLEETANKPLEPSGLKRPVEEQSQPKHQSPAQKIYAENRKKAEEAHRLLDRLGQKVELPLYNQPSDTNVYQENKTRHQTCMRTRLIARLRGEHSERASLHRQQSQTYAILVQEWHRKVERLESAQKRKSKETKNREFFEKVFPELRKQREDKERFNRVGARIKSEADLEEIMDGLQEQEMEDKKMRSYAVIPPLLLDAKLRRIAFQNRNGLLQPEELEALHSERKLINVWSAVEHELFKEKYLQHPKNFGAIAQNLEHKSVPDCVHHYYLTKKAENYKQLLRKSRQRTRSSRNNPNNKVNNSNSSIGPIDILTTGVTTRLQREQQQKTQENPQNNSTSTTTSSTTTTTNTLTTTTTTSSTPSSSQTSTSVPTSSSSTASDSGIVTTAASVQSTTTSTTNVLTTSTSSAKEAREANKENKENKNDTKESVVKDLKEEPSGDSTTGKDTKSTESSGGNSCVSVVGANETVMQTSEPKEKKKQAAVAASNVTTSRTKDKKKENHATPMETSDEEAQTLDPIESGRQLGPHACAICQNVVEGGSQSRALSRSQASQYGLREDQVQPGARVCNTCRCKAVRGRYTACPLPGCPNVNNANNKTRVKRLRALPPKWMELPPEIRDPVIQEFQIPNNATKCCSACFNRISRRLAPHLSGGADATDEASESIARQWTDDELKLFRRALREHGTNWPKVSEQIAGKSNHQCKNYYLTYRKKLGLDQVVAEYYQSLGEERRPCLTDEEESGSSTSSCDEMAVHDSSDTASAGSPANTISSSTPGSMGPSTATGTIKSSSFPQENTADIRISLVPPTPATSGPQQPTTAGGHTTNNREDYDSSATETADEGQGGADVENANSTAPSTTTTTSTSTILQSQTASQLQQSTQREQPPPGHSPPSTSNANPLTVKDLMFDVIEMQLKRNPNSTSTSSVTPTISSILKTDHRNDITFVREYKPSSSLPSTAMSNRDSNLATLSVVSVPHHTHRSAPSPQQIGQMQATITPMPPVPAPNQPPSADLLPKEGLVVMQVQQALRETEGTLDLSIKKPRQQPSLPLQSQPQPQEYNHTLQPPHKAPQMTMYRPEPPPGAYYHPHAHEQGRGAKSPLVYTSSPRPQAPITPKMNKVTVPSPHPKLSPKLANMSTPHKGGSITHGTPVSGARYEGLLRQMTPPGTASASANTPAPKESGSITQGTPVHPFTVEKRSLYDSHRPIRHSPATTIAPPQSPNQGVVVTHSNYNSYSARPPPSYTMEQQLSSRQIIMNDYITSQQMHQRKGTTASNESSSKTEPPPGTLYYTSTPPPPTPPQSHTQQRQGVIHRHNPQKQIHYHPPPAGLEAFSSLVDVAVQQPSLPVPHPHGHPPSGSSHEGLGKTMADRLLADRYVDNNRAYREQDLRRQRLAMEMAACHQRQLDRERDFHRQEKEYRMQKEREELQLLEHRLAVQHHQREKDMQQERIDREKQLQHEHMMQQREKEERLREQEMQHQREQIAAHQREKEHQEHRMAQQREKEIQHQREQLAVHQREKDMREKQEHRMAVHREREIAHLHQQQRMQEQQQMQQHILGQRMEAERRHMAQIFRDQQHQHIDRESGRLLSSGFSQSSRPQQPPPPPPPQQTSASSRPSPASSNSQSGENSTLTAASLIDAIITHQINQSFKSTSGAPTANNQPTRPGDRLFQGFHRDNPAEPNGVAHSPAAESSGGNSGPPSEPLRDGKSITLGEHVEHIVTKDFCPPHASYRSYPGYPLADDQWKRRDPEAESGKPGDERQIIRVSQGQQQSQVPQQAQQPPTSVAKQFHSVEPVSPPEATQNHYARRFYESATATTTSATPPKPHLSPLDYVKNKIVEVMRTSEDDKTTGSGERNSGNGTADKDDKPAESPSGEMVIDESPNPPTQQPPPAPTTFYPFSALGVHTGPPPAPPPPTSGSTTVTKSEQLEPAPHLSAQYEPLSDED